MYLYVALLAMICFRFQSDTTQMLLSTMTIPHWVMFCSKTCINVSSINFPISVSHPTSCVMTHQCQFLYWYQDFSPYLSQQQAVLLFLGKTISFLNLKHFARSYHCQRSTIPVMALLCSGIVFLGITSTHIRTSSSSSSWQHSWSSSLVKSAHMFLSRPWPVFVAFGKRFLFPHFCEHNRGGGVIFIWVLILFLQTKQAKHKITIQ